MLKVENLIKNTPPKLHHIHQRRGVYTYIYIYNVTFNDRLRLEHRHKVVTSHIAVSLSYTETGFISLSFTAYQFLVRNIGKKSYKIHSGIEKTTPGFLS